MSKTVWALVGGTSLEARELREVCEERKLQVVMRLLSGEKATAVLTQEGDEAAVIEPLSAEALDGAAVVLLAGTAEQGRHAIDLARGAGLSPVFIDLTGKLEEMPEARLRAPLVEADPRAEVRDVVQVIAHPAAAVLARFLLLLHRAFPVQQAVITVCEPASAHGQAAIDEMHQQTVSLLSFHPLPKVWFDVQATFNMLPRFGAEAKVSLDASEKTIERQLVTLLGPSGVPLPSLRVLHAPVFHGYVFSIYVRCLDRLEAGALGQVFAREGVDVRTSEHEPASNLGVAGQSGFTVSDITVDANHAEAAWFFVASDNLRVTAENGAMVAGLARGRA
jgi:aspartate-semialdehyde dehydrogenase